eukprot:CAMPEP_0113938816 /NCGR_PEP_ID=MMETSP1339-20121228/5238_1 /TAXON_ID=94617 /ORGANISM="Fibrocapsa japonica" /LENGTH=185 /DNA_ID=CAMNT_0000942105 /DNA_START=153 /DNA_END=710 /DNA_ORIENTATION=+ /assembly_acc=CAM_ASM_000762
MAKNLDSHLEELASSPGVLSSSPFGPISDSQNRRIVIDLISTMNASFPDHDFSLLRPEQFKYENNVGLVMNRVNAYLAELAATQNTMLLEELWGAIEESVKSQQWEVYSYIPDLEGDPFSEGNLWSFNYFFYNKNIRRILFFTCMSKSVDTSSSTYGSGDEEDAMSLDEPEVFPDWEDGEDSDGF